MEDFFHSHNANLRGANLSNANLLSSRHYPMRGFGNVASAARFCRAFDELRQYFRYRSTTRETMSPAQQRRIFCERLAALQELMGAVA
jgi:putative transposase